MGGQDAHESGEDTDPGEGSSRRLEDPETWSRDPAFQNAQETNETLEPTREAVAVSEGQVRDARRAAQLPCFEKTGGVWERVA